MTEESHAASVQATETSLTIIETLKRERSTSIADLSRMLPVSKSTIHNHVKTLEQRGYLVKEGDQQYRLGLAFFDIGEHARDNVHIYHAAVPVIDELVRKTGMKAQVMVEEQGEGYYVYSNQGNNAIKTRIGRKVRLHCTSAGKAVLAHLPDERVESILDEFDLDRRTTNTITDRDELMEELEEVREQGFAFNDEERLKGLRAVGAPILDEEGAVLGAVSVSGPTTRMNNAQFHEEMPEKVQHSANVILIRLKNE